MIRGLAVTLSVLAAACAGAGWSALASHDVCGARAFVLGSTIYYTVLLGVCSASVALGCWECFKTVAYGAQVFVVAVLGCFGGLCLFVAANITDSCDFFKYLVISASGGYFVLCVCVCLLLWLLVCNHPTAAAGSPES